MSYTETWDETKPAGDRDINLGDNDIRETKRALRERLAKNHEFVDDETGDTKIGMHKMLDLISQVSSVPTAVDDVGNLYALDVDDVAELYYQDESSNRTLITRLGAIVTGSVVHQAKAATDTSMATNTYADLLSMTITETFKKCNALITFTAPIKIAGNVSAWFQVLVDDVQVVYAKHSPAAGAGTTLLIPICIHVVEALTAGAHTIKVQWKANGTISQSGTTEGERVLTVQEIRT